MIGLSGGSFRSELNLKRMGLWIVPQVPASVDRPWEINVVEAAFLANPQQPWTSFQLAHTMLG